MTEKIKVKDSEKSQLVLSFNWKEETLLKKKINTLDSLQRQREDSYTLDQRILYNRFRMKLRRSELAHARQMGNKELLLQLQHNGYSFNTTVKDDSEKAVKRIVHSAPPSSRQSIRPCRMVTAEPRPPRTQVDAWTPEQDHRGEPALLWKESRKKVTFGRVRPHTTSVLLTQKTSSLQRPHTAMVTVPKSEMLPCVNTESELHARTSSTARKLQEPDLSLTTTPDSKDDDEAQQELSEIDRDSKQVDIDEQNVATSPKDCLNGSVEKTRPPPSRVKPKRQDFKSLFLQSYQQDNIKQSLAAEQLMGMGLGQNNSKYGSRVVNFFEKVTDLKLQQRTELSDYYSERLLQNLNGRSKQNREAQLLRSIQEEEGKWRLQGREEVSRSVTLRKLVWNCSRYEIPHEVLFLESYGALLTKENRDERNWLDNNPY